MYLLVQCEENENAIIGLRIAPSTNSTNTTHTERNRLHII